ncbi:MAG: hypothetical protein COZ80_04285 [Ignavibacteria bacterium CG_4_8_14_3_um_filter_37_9]|nr:hypothetical protein [Ignavibacteria bacterium]OIO16760.1 MAG: hypothetical protein AUJ54_10895 [Ignavibacteria bacterium CG1_02_37_35]PIS44382.1 MAG: hypothetical protein COT22_10840 [Ignavibacteria bacterium CG08_land_8_20_14_0_20_37_9]PIW99649.1 MAG: hypothetical protein COZ80_04285 [Ignavibacteria bacterium CG_4_8_14_3_um_filter_37_9]PIX93987.1 MAG: hypothetical protein COZ25_07870 [Ignavibacteria bacterium CG_4_10_14_3_um_filter_37_18]PJC57483.1 MAG: hypothetical protein CO025_13150 [I
MKTVQKILFVFLTMFVFTNPTILAQEKNDFLIKGIDASVDPGVDFFKYATSTLKIFLQLHFTPGYVLVSWLICGGTG